MYYTAADGDGQAAAAREASVDVGGDPGTATERRHPFYARLNQILEQHDFDGFVEGLCERFYADEGRPGLPPGRYFRLLLIGYFEGLDAVLSINPAGRSTGPTSPVARATSTRPISATSSGSSPGSRRHDMSKSGGGSCANIPATCWTAGPCRPIDFLQERQPTKP